MDDKPSTLSRLMVVYKSMGHAMEDLVAANLVYQKAVKAGIGKEIEM